MVQYTEWRSISDGSIISSIPDSGLLLDDFANDPTVTTSEITDRKDFTELEYQEEEPEESDHGPVETRPDWTVQEGSPSVDTGESKLQVGGGDQLFTELTEVDDLTWEFEFELSGDVCVFAIFCADENASRSDTFGVENAYYIRMRNDDIMDFRVNENGSTTTLISGPFEEGTIKITRTDSGEFELFINGQSQGTETDTTITESETMVLQGRSEETVNFDINDIKVY